MWNSSTHVKSYLSFKRSNGLGFVLFGCYRDIIYCNLRINEDSKCQSWALLSHRKIRWSLLPEHSNQLFSFPPWHFFWNQIVFPLCFFLACSQTLRGESKPFWVNMDSFRNIFFLFCFQGPLQCRKTVFLIRYFNGISSFFPYHKAISKYRYLKD